MIHTIGVALLWLLSAASVGPAHAPVDHRAAAAPARGAHALAPLVSPPRTSDEDDDGHHDDAPAAHAAVCRPLALQPIGIVDDPFVERPIAILRSPRSPRGPPASA